MSSSQTDKDVTSEDCSHQRRHGCSMCNTKMQIIEEKLVKLLFLLPEFEPKEKNHSDLSAFYGRIISVVNMLRKNQKW